MIKLDKNTIKLCIVLLVICASLLFPAITKAAILYLLPQSQTIYQGDSFVVIVRVDTEGEDINAIEGHLNFPQDKLEIIDTGKGGSVLSLWPKEPFYSNQTGEISFTGGIPGGFQGQGELLSIIFRVLPRIVPRESASITFKEDSKVLLHDGKGTPAKLSFLEGNYEIIEKPERMPVVSSKSHPDQNKWYKNRTLHLHWDLVEGAQYSFVLSRDPLAEPDETPDRPEGELIWMGDMEYKDLEDGIYYFFLREYAKPKWGPKLTFRAMLDGTPPEPFEPEIAKDPSMFEGKYFLSFATTDKTSGIDHYEIIEADRRGYQRRTTRKAEWKIGESPYLLEDQSLRSIIKVKAVDKAGNEKIAEIIPPYKITWKDVLPWIVLALIIVGVIWWIIKSRNRRRITAK